MVYKYCFLISCVFLIMTLYSVKKRKLDFRFTLLWFLVSLTLLIFSLDKNIIEEAAYFTGIFYAPAFLFLSGIVFSLIIIFYMAVMLSSMQKRVVRLTQEIGILKSMLEGRKGK